jgi:hypothetical protein
MIVLLRNEISHDTQSVECCAIRTNHVEFFGNRIEIIYPSDGDVTQIDVINRDGDLYFRWGETYDFCVLYDDDSEADVFLNEDFPKCKWYED